MFTHRIHNHLLDKLNWYNRYHQWQHHHKIHWAVLVIYVLSVVSFGVTSLSQAPKAQAAEQEIAATLTSGSMPERVTSGPGGQGASAEAVYDFGELHTVTSYSVTLECSGSGGLQAKAYLYLSTNDADYTLIKSTTGCATLDGTTNTSARYAKWRIEINLPTFYGPGFIDLSSPHLFEPASDPPPTISIGSPSNNCAGGKYYTRSSSVTVSGTAADTSPGTVSSVTVNGGAATGTTSWSKSGVSLGSEGDNTITAVATDNSSQTSNPASITVYKDTTAPTVTISSPAEGTVTSSSTATISGSASDNSGGSGLTSVSSSTGSSVSGTSSWSTTVNNLSPGSNTITITATDCAGNQGTRSVGIVYQDGTGGGDPDPDTVSKSITVTAPNGGESYLTGVGTGALSFTTITWTTQNISASEKIKLSYTTNNSTYTTIADNESNDGSYSWTLPSAKSTSVKVKAELTTDAAVSDTSDNTLTLHSNSAPVLSL